MKYTVIVTREDDSWLADVPQVAGAHTFARSLDGLLKSVREVIVLMDDLRDDAQIELSLKYEVDDDLIMAASNIGDERAELAVREAELQNLTAAMVNRLGDHGVSVRDTARLLRMTPGRVSQLAKP